MRIDMRPKVAMRVMSKELVLVGISIICMIGMPLYYLKMKKIKDDYAEAYQDKLQRNEIKLSEKLKGKKEEE